MSNQQLQLQISSDIGYKIKKILYIYSCYNIHLVTINSMSKIPRQAVIALVSAFVTEIVFGSIYTFGALIPYISSYLYYRGNPTSSTSLSILFTMTIIMINVGVGICSTFLHHVSNRVLCAGSIISLSIAVFVVSFMDNFVGFVAFYGVFYGLSIGIGYYPPVKNTYLHLPDRKGLCAGICYSGFGLGSVIFNYIILEIINPQNIDIDKVTKKYPQDIANRLPLALQILAGTYIVMGLFGSFFIQPPKKKLNQLQKLVQQEQNIENEEKEEKQIIASIQSDQTPFQMFKRKKIYLLLIQVACIAPFGMFTAFNYKRIAFDRNPYFLENDHLVTTIGSVGILCNGLFRLVWGYLFDHLSFKTIILFINWALMVFSALILFAVQNPISYFFMIPLIYLCYGGIYAILPTQTVRIFGRQKGAKIFWLTFTGLSLAAVIQFTLQYFILTYGGQSGYVYCISAFFGLEVIGLIISCLVKYQYEQEEIIKKSSTISAK